MYLNQQAPAGAGFLSAAAQGYDLGRRVRMDQALAKEADLPTDQLGLATVANPEDTGPQPASADGQESPRQGPIQVTDPAAQQAARTQRRAQVYRQFGQDAEADKLLSNNAGLGLTNAQTGEVQQRTAREKVATDDATLGLSQKKTENDRLIKARGIEDDIMGQLPQGASQADVNAARAQVAVQQAQAGLGDHALQTGKQLTESISQQIKAQSEQRQADIGQLNREISSGNFANVPAVLQKYSLGLSGLSGAQLHDIQPGQQPGTSVVTFTDMKGSNQQKVVPTSQLQGQMLEQLHKLSGDSTATAMADEQIKSTIKMHEASARASNASAARSDVETGAIKDNREHQAEVNKAFDGASEALQKPEAERTPQDKADIQRYQTLVAKYSVRNGGAAGGSAAGQARTMNAKVNVRDVTIKTAADGTPGEYLDQRSPTDKTMVWKPITRGDVVQPSAGGAPGAAPAPAQPASRPPLAAFQR